MATRNVDVMLSRPGIYVVVALENLTFVEVDPEGRCYQLTLTRCSALIAVNSARRLRRCTAITKTTASRCRFVGFARSATRTSIERRHDAHQA